VRYALIWLACGTVLSARVSILAHLSRSLPEINAASLRRRPTLGRRNLSDINGPRIAHSIHLTSPARSKEGSMYKRVLLAYDGSESGQKALLNCRDIAQWSHSELFLVAIMPSPINVAVDGAFYDGGSDVESERQRFQAILADGLKQLSEAGHAATGEVLVGDSVDHISSYARQISADLIVVGHRHLDGWAERWWRGSSTRALIEHAPCSVLVVITH
jgi:nucleotide-binding universal stress UspA family protein